MLGLYGFLLVGATLLLLDVTGRLRFSARRARWWRWIGVGAAAGPGLAPLLAWVTGQLSVSWPYPLIAFGYLALFLTFAFGTLAPVARRNGVAAQRVAYLGLLVIAALPSMVLLLLTPLVAAAGMALARPRCGAESAR